jgi:hypothetical protein
VNRGLALIFLTALLHPAAEIAAQQPPPRPATAPARRVARTDIDSIRGTPNYDVVLEVPNLSVDSIVLRVNGVRVQVALDVRAANLVAINAGAQVSIDSVSLTIAGVGAEAYAYIDLDNVARIVNRVVQTLDRNPELVTTLLSVVDTTVGTVGGLANTALQPGGVVGQTVGAVGGALNQVTRPGGLLSQTINTLGQTVQTVLEPAGAIIERTIGTAGALVSQRTLGNVLSLPVVRETAGQAGQVVKQVRDQTGRIIEFTQSATGAVSAARVLPAAGTNQ